MHTHPLNINTPGWLDLSTFEEQAPSNMLENATQFYKTMQRRKTIREFSNRPVARAVIEQCLLAAGTAPSGANHQPWHFAVIESPSIKQQIRLAAEAEERDFYTRRAPQDWKEALAPLGTDAEKPFLEIAPYLIVIFGQKHCEFNDGLRLKNYYVPESVNIATGFLIAALHHSGLATLTHTPSPMGFLNEICGRSKDEKPYILLVVGYPAEHCQVPNILKKPLHDIASFL
ncbi:nitroreductase family protein [Iodobacter sp. CM08]|uniref:nitroreductase family protein n=1 Tax=Iodobacter sp. CM08 TaxID=3085902 RepID=UPI00298285E3|nr:nitroreductase family protein [Iodobacter sp. CM08]MDW5415685.1 nitroreductase family protein [Iodobacter sp. CM08]